MMMTAMAEEQKLPEQLSTSKKQNLFLKFLKNNIFIILSFVIPFILMTVAFGVMEVSPFGDKQILVTDLWHQYYPFLVDFQQKLKHGESLFFSWTQGGGVNYFSLMSYYLAGPLNFLCVFVPSQYLREFLMFSVVAKISFASCFTAIFLRYVFKRNDFTLIAFGSAFGFCAFFMGYYWNTIWLDSVCVFPLVALGTYKLLVENKIKTYVISLAISLLANYYIGLFSCIFILLAFISYSIIKWNGIKKFFTNIIKTGVFSIISIGLTTFFLLPAYFALKNAHASSSTFPKTFAINIGSSNDLQGTLDALKKIFTNFLSFIEPATKEADALPNIACGTACIVLAILFFTCTKIGLKEKLVNGGLVLFMLISCVIRQLDYIWHGFHFTNMIPYRFTYIISFMIVVMAFRALTLIDFSSMWDILIVVLFTAVIVLISIGTQEKAVIIGTSVIAALLCAVMLLYTKRLVPRIVVTIVLTIVIVAESGATAYIGVKTTTVTGTYDYPRGGEDAANIISYMNTLEDNTPELWRAETTTTQTLNDGSLNGYNGLSMFNSMANESMTNLFENMGLMGWQSGNRYTYAESSPIANTFLNLKYIIARNGIYRNTYNLDNINQIGTVTLLENKNYIPMGFMVKKSLLNWEINTHEDQFNPFDQQNDFFRQATGIGENVYTQLEVVSQGHTDYSQFPVNKLSYGNYSYSCTDSSVTPHVKWNYSAPKTGYYFMYADIDGGDDVTVMINDVSQSSTYGMGRSYIACIGECNEGDKISVYATLPQNKSGSARVYVNMLNEDVFEKGYQIISKNYMQTTKLTGSSVEGTIKVDEDGLFYTSIPNEDTWQAYVDGKKVEITPVGDALVAFGLSAGEHKIKLVYYPKGFWPGLLASSICLLIFVAFCVYNNKANKKEYKK